MSMDDATSEYPKYGFDVDNIIKILLRFKCIFCLLIINDPIQLGECGHRSCKGCSDARADDDPNDNVTCPCDDCGAITNKEQFMPDRAFRKELDVLPVICRFKKSHGCDWKGQLKDYQSHLDDKHIHYICQACNEQFSSKILLDEHITKLCPEIFQKCPLAPFCTEEMIRKTDFGHHLHTEKHQETVTKLLTGEYKYSEIPTNFEQDAERERRREELERETKIKLDSLTKDTEKLMLDSNKINENFEQLHKRLNAVKQDLNSSYVAINERTSIKQSLQPNQEKLQKDLESLQETYQEIQNISADGTLTWRVERVSEKMTDAQSERQTSIYSPIFYSSPTGYQMRARLFLFGDGNARRTHMSLFFLLMKGEYDAILKWPFHYKVTFCLLDQTGNNRHIIDSFYPDVKSNSFQRPKDTSNVASGIPKFFPLPMLLQDDNAYVREDTLYIKIIVGLNETPKTMLPFMLTLNPALPTFVQESLINQENLKRQQQETTPATTNS